MDARAGIITIKEAKKLAKKYDPMKPKILDYYLSITGYEEKDFEKKIKKHRSGKAKNLPDPKLMKKNNLLSKEEVNDSVKDYISKNSEKMIWQKKINSINNELLFPNFFETKAQNFTNKKINNQKLLSLSINEKRNLIRKKIFLLWIYVMVI